MFGPQHLGQTSNKCLQESRSSAGGVLLCGWKECRGEDRRARRSVDLLPSPSAQGGLGASQGTQREPELGLEVPWPMVHSLIWSLGPLRTVGQR